MNTPCEQAIVNTAMRILEDHCAAELEVVSDEQMYAASVAMQKECADKIDALNVEGSTVTVAHLQAAAQLIAGAAISSLMNAVHGDKHLMAEHAAHSFDDGSER